MSSIASIYSLLVSDRETVAAYVFYALSQVSYYLLNM